MPQQPQCGWPSAPGVSQRRTRQSYSDLRGLRPGQIKKTITKTKSKDAFLLYNKQYGSALPWEGVQCNSCRWLAVGSSREKAGELLESSFEAKESIGPAGWRTRMRSVSCSLQNHVLDFLQHLGRQGSMKH